VLAGRGNLREEGPTDRSGADRLREIDESMLRYDAKSSKLQGGQTHREEKTPTGDAS
jgi:hypothetical protein